VRQFSGFEANDARQLAKLSCGKGWLGWAQAAGVNKMRDGRVCHFIKHHSRAWATKKSVRRTFTRRVGLAQAAGRVAEG
jgi:hypothetical protein